MIAGQNTKIDRQAHGMTYDPAHDEIFISASMASSVLSFKGGESGNVKPLRAIQGPKTYLHGPWGVGVDDVNNELAVADFTEDALIVFRRDADGNVAPLRMIKGSKTTMVGPSGVAFDPDDNLVVGINSRSTGWTNGRIGIFIFNRTASGNTAPLRIIAGPHTGIYGGWHVAVYQGKIYAVAPNFDFVPNYGRLGYAPRKGCTGPELPPQALPSTHMAFVGVWNITDSGDVPPRAIIGGANTELVSPGSIALDPRDGEIIVSDQNKNGLYSFLVPQLYGQF